MEKFSLFADCECNGNRNQRIYSDQFESKVNPNSCTYLFSAFLFLFYAILLSGCISCFSAFLKVFGECWYCVVKQLNSDVLYSLMYQSLPHRVLRLQGCSTTVQFNILHMVLSLITPTVENINLPSCAREYLVSALAYY